MTDLLFWGASVGLIAASGAASALAARVRSRTPLLSRIRELEDDLSRERASARRRESEAARRSEGEVRSLRVALGLPADGDDTAGSPRGRALAEKVVERLHGLATVDRCIVADEEGLAWTSDDFPDAAGLGASAGAALAATLRGTLLRSLHVELSDARHIVVRPLPGTMPRLALAVLSTSRPASPFALDAVLAHASLLAAAGDAGSAGDPITGWTSHVSRSDAPVTVRIARELEDAAPSVASGAMALFVGEELVAAHGTDGPRQEDLPAFAATLREALGRIEARMGCAARRIDWVGDAGAAITLAPLGVSRRTSVLVTCRRGPVDGAAFDRLGGRLRRMLPPEAGQATHEARA